MWFYPILPIGGEVSPIYIRPLPSGVTPYRPKVVNEERKRGEEINKDRKNMLGPDAIEASQIISLISVCAPFLNSFEFLS